MRVPDLDKILSAMLQTYEGISDLNFSVGHPLQVEDFGELKPVFVDPPIDALTPYQTEQIALTLMQGNRRLIYDFLTGGSCDSSYSLNEEARFRVNIFRQQGNFSIVMRKLEGNVPTIQSLSLPPIFEAIAKEKTGLVLVTGATGSGKTTTLAAILNQINETQSVHVVTWKIRSSLCIPPAKPLSISANWDTILTIIPTACVPRCARRRRSFW